MPNHTAGARPYDTGLVIQSKPEVDTNEFGMMEATFNFLTSISNWPSKQPARATPCNEFITTDTPTQTFLTGVSFLGCQTSKWKPARLSDSNSPGILEVRCQGAIFSDTVTETLLRVADVPVTNKGAGYTSVPSVAFSGGGQVIPAVAVARIEAATRQVNNGGTGYEVGDVLTASGGSFVTPAKLLVDQVSGGGSIKVADGGLTHFLDHGSYSVKAGITAVAFTGGSGSGATVDLTWRIDDVFITAGGAYSSTPTASLSGGSPTTPGTLGTVVMGSGVGEDAEITTPFNPISTTKDTVQFSSYVTADQDLTARLVATSDLGAVVYSTQNDGTIRLDSAFDAIIPAIDGIDPSEGDLILLTAMANSAYNGLYKLLQRGELNAVGGEPWEMARVAAMNEADEVTTQVYIHISDGTGNANTRWHCTTTITTLGTDAIAFEVVAASGGPTAAALITIEYEAIDLHFEYMSRNKVERPRFIQDEYTVDGSGLITIDPITGEKQLLAIDSATSQAAIIDPDTRATTYDPVAFDVSESVWRPLVRYQGTASRFEQTPAGAVWHVLETTTIKIDPIQSAA